jgi:hypothetical protein
MGSHDQNKLWPKERSEVKLSIWLPTTKSWVLLWFTCVQVTCHIHLKSSQKWLWLCFKTHFNQKSSQELWACKVVGVPILGISRLPNWKPWNKMTFGCRPRGQAQNTENIIKGNMVISPKFGSWWSLWVCVCSWFACAPKVLQLHTNQLVV